MSEIAPKDGPQKVIESWDELERRGHNQFVTINYALLDNLAAQNPDLKQPNWKTFMEDQHPQNDWAFATQVDVADTINYMFLNRDIEKDGESWTMTDPSTGKVLSGSTALMTRLFQRFGEAEDITASEIEQLAEPEMFAKLLPGIPMAESRIKQLKKYAQGLREGYEGSVRNLIEASIDETGSLRLFNDGKGMIERRLKEEFDGAFVDTNTVDDLVFPHNKRANLTPILIDGRAQGSKVLPRVTDINLSGGVPDYRVPQAQRANNELIYTSSLAEIVDHWGHIEAGSRMEGEIRGACVKSLAYWLSKVNAIRAEAKQEPYTMAHADFWKWKMGRDLKKQGDTSLPHFTETTAY
jgi:hypothetical protein